MNMIHTSCDAGTKNDVAYAGTERRSKPRLQERFRATVHGVNARGHAFMPGTARRFGDRNVFDPAESVMGGTRYLKELLVLWGGRVDLALASYNAGEGAVMKYGKRVPPYRETRNYVRLIGARYGRGSAANDTAPTQAPPDATP